MAFNSGMAQNRIYMKYDGESMCFEQTEEKLLVCLLITAQRQDVLYVVCMWGVKESCYVWRHHT